VLVWKRAHTKSGRAPRFDMSMCLKCDIDSQQNGGNRQARRRTSVPAVNQVFARPPLACILCYAPLIMRMPLHCMLCGVVCKRVAC
jgi:hypothetical protein